jgi:hypothetical protein
MWQSHGYCDAVKNNDIMAIGPSQCYPTWWDSANKFTNGQLKYYASLLDSNIKLSSTDKQACDLVQKYNPSADWIKAQQEYYNTLTKNDKDILSDYTRHGDEILNEYLRGDTEKIFDVLAEINFWGSDVFNSIMGEMLTYDDLIDDTKIEIQKYIEDNINKNKEIDKRRMNWIAMGFSPQENPHVFNEQYLPATIDDILQQYYKDIIRFENWKEESILRVLNYIAKKIDEIIKNAPRLDKNIYVYRGVKDIDYLNKCELVKGLISTTLDFTVALDFATKENEDEEGDEDGGENEEGDGEDEEGEDGEDEESKNKKTIKEIKKMPYILRILIPKGTSGLLLNEVTKFKSEAEVLFPNNSKLCIEKCIDNVPVTVMGFGAKCHNNTKITNINICNAALKN